MLGVMRKRTRHIAFAVAVMLVMGAAAYWSYGKLTHNLSASCANCRSFAGGLLDEYAANHEGQYPTGGTNALHSLSRCVNQAHEVHFFTSHAQANGLEAYWQKHKSFTADLCCYRYVEGLNTNDPEGLIVLYYWKPTRWECRDHKKPELGRSVCFLSSPGELRVSFGSWRFVPETEFQEQLARTLAYLREDRRLPGPQP